MMNLLSSCIFFFLVILFSSFLFLPEQVGTLYAQNSTVSQLSSTATATQPTPTTLGVKITTPTNEQQIFFNNNSDLQLKGTSTDNADKDCQVSVIANDIRPYQNVIATGQEGNNDYSIWTYSLSPPLLKEGSNKVTARISCANPNTTTSNLSTDSTGQVKHSSIFFTVLNATASVSNTTSPIIANASDTTQTLATPTTIKTKTTSSGTNTRTSAVPYFVLNPSCKVDQSTHDLNCITKIAGIENIAKIRPFLHADLTTSCINPAGNAPPEKTRTTSLIGNSKTIQAAVDVNCPPPMTPSYTYENVELQVGDVLLLISGIFSSPR
jgi:hypothetical protein